jgi:hypothetical protein
VFQFVPFNDSNRSMEKDISLSAMTGVHATVE